MFLIFKGTLVISFLIRVYTVQNTVPWVYSKLYNWIYTVQWVYSILLNWIYNVHWVYYVQYTVEQYILLNWIDTVQWVYCVHCTVIVQYTIELDLHCAQTFETSCLGQEQITFEVYFDILGSRLVEGQNIKENRMKWSRNRTI